jgi:hypothetical protein
MHRPDRPYEPMTIEKTTELAQTRASYFGGGNTVARIDRMSCLRGKWPDLAAAMSRP